MLFAMHALTPRLATLSHPLKQRRSQNLAQISDLLDDLSPLLKKLRPVLGHVVTFAQMLIQVKRKIDRKTQK